MLSEIPVHFRLLTGPEKSGSNFNASPYSSKLSLDSDFLGWSCQVSLRGDLGEFVADSASSGSLGEILLVFSILYAALLHWLSTSRHTKI